LEAGVVRMCGLLDAGGFDFLRCGLTGKLFHFLVESAFLPDELFFFCMDRVPNT
jgi:hypothetical protein